jgi:hypothetical protein
VFKKFYSCTLNGAKKIHLNQIKTMTFWENVDSELKYQNKTRKQLASELGFDATTISKGISNGSIPQADRN